MTLSPSFYNLCCIYLDRFSFNYDSILSILQFIVVFGQTTGFDQIRPNWFFFFGI